MEEKIIIKGARVHNLQNVNLEVPKNKLVVFTGVSGSGKSSLAFDTIFAEGQRRYIESLSPYARQFLGQMERADVDEIIGLSPSIAIDQKALSHNPRSTVGTLTEIYDYLRVLFARLGEVYCPKCGTKIEKLSLEEMADIILDRAKDVGAETITILSPVVRARKGEYYQLFYDFLNMGYAEARIDGKFHSLHERIVLSKYKQHNIDIVVDRLMPSEENRLFEAVENALDYSGGLVSVILDEAKKLPIDAEHQRESVLKKISVDQRLNNQRKSALNKNLRKSAFIEFMLSSKWTCPEDNFSFPEIEPRLFSFNSPAGACPVCSGLGKTDLFLKTICPDCGGKRLKPEALSVRINGKNINEVSAMPIGKIYEFFGEYKKKLTPRQKTIAQNIVKEISDRLHFLIEVGLDYLALTREAETLSGGEAQRIRLASQIGSRLSNTLYVLDEPTIGLHERDTDRLVKTLKSLRDQHNTVIVVEHDERTILESDYLVDLGPLAGSHGGKVMAGGETLKLIEEAKKSKSLTLKYLSGEKAIEIPKRRHKETEKLKIIGAKANNLKNIDVEIPLRKFICVTGVSGSGKSSFVEDVLEKNLTRLKSGFGNYLEHVAKITGSEYVDRVVVMDQSPIGRTPRSNPATYTGVFTPIRDFFAMLPESRERAYKPSRFSFNVAGGRCEACQGAGHNLIEMHFLPPVMVQCEVCHGKRFSRETLQIEYKGKNISQVLDMTIDDALEFFSDIYLIADKLKVLVEVGLGYLKLGQSATTLSGGEAQRIKLARELTQSIGTLGKRTLYLLDEPTVGLHYYDIELLLKVLNKLIDKQNSVVVIEHNLHVIKSADYVIDLGPEGGDKGGMLVAKGTPEEVANNPKSITGKYLKEALKK